MVNYPKTSCHIPFAHGFSSTALLFQKLTFFTKTEASSSKTHRNLESTYGKGPFK